MTKEERLKWLKEWLKKHRTKSVQSKTKTNH